MGGVRTPPNEWPLCPKSFVKGLTPIPGSGFVSTVLGTQSCSAMGSSLITVKVNVGRAWERKTEGAPGPRGGEVGVGLLLGEGLPAAFPYPEH